MADLEQLVRRVSQLTGIECRPASEDDLEVLRDLDVPETVIAFFAKYEPAEAMEYGPCISTISEIEDLCNDGSTGEAAFKVGLIPFGDLICGDTLCFDPASLDEDGWPAIVTVSHESVFEDSTEEEVFAGTQPYCTSLPALLEVMLANAARKRARQQEEQRPAVAARLAAGKSLGTVYGELFMMCPTCGGQGQVIGDLADGRGPWQICPRCNGDRFVARELP